MPTVLRPRVPVRNARRHARKDFAGNFSCLSPRSSIGSRSPTRPLSRSKFPRAAILPARGYSATLTYPLPARQVSLVSLSPQKLDRRPLHRRVSFASPPHLPVLGDFPALKDKSA